MVPGAPHRQSAILRNVQVFVAYGAPSWKEFAIDFPSDIDASRHVWIIVAHETMMNGKTSIAINPLRP